MPDRRAVRQPAQEREGFQDLHVWPFAHDGHPAVEFGGIREGELSQQVAAIEGLRSQRCPCVASPGRRRLLCGGVVAADRAPA